MCSLFRLRTLPSLLFGLIRSRSNPSCNLFVRGPIQPQYIHIRPVMGSALPPPRSTVSRVWTCAVSHPLRIVRLAAMTTIYAVMLLRASRLYRRWDCSLCTRILLTFSRLLCPCLQPVTIVSHMLWSPTWKAFVHPRGSIMARDQNDMARLQPSVPPSQTTQALPHPSPLTHAPPAHPPPGPPLPPTHAHLPIHPREASALLAVELVLCLALGPLTAVPLTLGLGIATLWEMARREPEENLGGHAACTCIGSAVQVLKPPFCQNQ